MRAVASVADRVLDALDLAIDFLTLGEYGLEQRSAERRSQP